MRLEDFRGCRGMKERIIFFFLFACTIILIKALFFSGAEPSFHPQVYKGQTGLARTVIVSAGSHYQRGRVGRFLLGKHWRPIWATPVAVPVLDFSHTFGGLKPGKLGGGMQTTSLHVSSADGRRFVLRSLDKNPVGVLAPFWRHSILADLVQDQVSAANPYAALVVAPLSRAAGLLHANPQLVFIAASDPHIQTHRQRLGNRLFWLEEKFTNQTVAAFDSAAGVYNSVEMLDRHFRLPGHQIDQKDFVRCRLFDMLLGDWDRHEGQWSWVAFRNKGTVWYKPIPKDRDQAFSRYRDGVLPWLLTRNFVLPKFGHFDKNLDDIIPFTINSAFIDQKALNQLQRSDFLLAARHLQQTLTDEVIDQAVRQFPPEVYKQIGSEIAFQLKQRRKQLPRAAEAFYRHLAKNVVVTGTDQKDRFVITRLNSHQTLVQVYQASAGDLTLQKAYQRFFNHNETQSITLHGLAGDDDFVLSGVVEKGITIKIVGGLGADKVRDHSLVHQGSRKTLVFDTRQGNKIQWGAETEDKTTDHISVHNFDREGY